MQNAELIKTIIISKKQKGKKWEKLEKFIQDFSDDCFHRTMPGKVKWNTTSGNETDYQRKIFESKTRLMPEKSTVEWYDLELPVTFSGSGRRDCIDLIGKVGDQFLLCELKHMKTSQGDNPVYAMYEALKYYYCILKNHPKMDKLRTVHHEGKDCKKFKWGDFASKPIIMVVANKNYWDCWLAKGKGTRYSDMLKSEIAKMEEIGIDVRFYKTGNIDEIANREVELTPVI